MKKWFVLISLLINLPVVLYAKPFAIHRWETSKGTRIFFYQAMEVPMLTVNLAFAAGSAYDGKYYGLSALTANLLDQGSNGLDASTIAEQLADTGAQFTSESSRDMLVLNLKTLSEPQALNQTMQVFSLLINKADFPNEAFKRKKNQQLMAIAQTEESPNDLANQIFFQTLYQEHPYAHPVNGTKEAVERISNKQVREFYQRYLVASNAVMVLVGSIDLEKAKELAEQLTKDLPKGQPAPAIAKAKPLSTKKQIAINYPSSQMILRLGQVGIDHHNPNYFPLTVGNYILGGGALVSRLADEVREKRGFTYNVQSQFLPMPGNGPFLISLATRTSQAKQALAVTKTTLANFLAHGPTKKELQEAKQFLTGSFPLSLASNSDIANVLLRIAFYRLPDDYLDTYLSRINAVTLDAINRAFKQELDPEQMLLILVGNQ